MSISVKLIKLINVTTESLFILILLIVLSCTIVQAQAEDTAETTEAMTETSPRASFIHFENDCLTVKVQDISLKELLNEIARQSGIILTLYSSLEERITIQFHDLPRDEGLRRILSNQRIVMKYAQQKPEDAKSPMPRVRRLWVLSRGEEDSPVQTIPDVEKAGASRLDNQGLQAAMASEDPEERQDAIAQLFLAMEDENEVVPEEVIAVLEDIGDGDITQAWTIKLQREEALFRKELEEDFAKNGGYGESSEDLAERQDPNPHLLLTTEDQDEELSEEAIALLENMSAEEINHEWANVLKEAMFREEQEEPEDLSGEDRGDEE